MIGWIFKRTLLAFASVLGGILLILVGFVSCGYGASDGHTWLMFIGGILILIGLFLMAFSKNLAKWFEIKHQ